jgi:hypothetical protein
MPSPLLTQSERKKQTQHSPQKRMQHSPQPSLLTTQPSLLTMQPMKAHFRLSK